MADAASTAASSPVAPRIRSDMLDAQLAGGFLPGTGPVPHKSAFPPIDDYAFLSDCENNCLIARNGSVEWLCLPRPDSPSVFGAMLDRSAGQFRVGPYGVNVPAARRYLPGGMIVETTWQTDTGWLVVRDALVLGPWHDNDRRSVNHHRPPGDWDAEHMLLRTVKCVNGVVELDLRCEPAFDYHRVRSRWEYSGQVYEQARCHSRQDTDSGAHAGLVLTLTTDLRLGLEGSGAYARTRMSEGDEVFVALSWSQLPPPHTYTEAAQKMWATTEYWRRWITMGRFPDHPWRGFLQRSALTLKGLTYAPTGALLAAPTTSLPETPGGERNWDYRYSWIRDSNMALWGLYTLGYNREADDYFSFLYDVASDDNGGTRDLQVLYGVGGERDLTEFELRDLSGYDGAHPVRVGNGAAEQDQHDIWGSVLDSVYLHVKSRGEVPDALWPMLERQVRAAIEHWREPDRGIWEIRGEPQQFTHSKVMCWVALDRGARLAEMHGELDCAREWAEIAEEIRNDVLEHGVNAEGIFTQAYGKNDLDASLLMLPLVRFLPPDDIRIRNTVLAIAEHLTERGLVLRYRTETTDDGLSGKEGTFTICSFWLVSALVEIGEVYPARRLCQRLLGFASPLELYAEEIDVRSGRHMGNFPQAFTHLALINALMHLIRAEQAVGAGDFQPAHRHN